MDLMFGTAYKLKKTLDFSDFSSKLFILISITDVFNLIPVIQLIWMEKNTQASCVVVYSIVNMDRKNKSREMSEEKDNGQAC